MNRREFLRNSLVLSAGLAEARRLGAQAALRVAAFGAATVPSTQFLPLRGGAGVFTGRGGTIGWFSSKDALAVVDTQFPDTAAACLAGIPGIGKRTVDATINTHHHIDHTGGNPVFRPASRVLVAQDNVPRLQFEAARRAEQNPTPRADPAMLVDRQVYADTTFGEVWRRELGGEIITAEFRGPAHTGGDAVVIFEKANVVHMGDLVFNRIYPFVDRPGGRKHPGLDQVARGLGRGLPGRRDLHLRPRQSEVRHHGRPGRPPGHARLPLGRHGARAAGRRRRPRQAGGGRGGEPPGLPRLQRAPAEPAGIGARSRLRRIDWGEKLTHPRTP